MTAKVLKEVMNPSMTSWKLREIRVSINLSETSQEPKYLKLFWKSFKQDEQLFFWKLKKPAKSTMIKPNSMTKLLGVMKIDLLHTSW